MTAQPASSPSPRGKQPGCPTIIDAERRRRLGQEKPLEENSSIQGGRDKVRRLRYMTALPTTRRNPDFERKYTVLLDAGKPGKVAVYGRNT